MKKIMFNDRFGLTNAVLEGRKTMTRRILKAPRRFHGVDAPQLEFHRNTKGLCFDCVLIDDDGHELGQMPLPYEVGEIVAIAQSYHSLNKSGYVAPEWSEHTCESSAGYENKMFVKADLMPNRIKITDLWFERIQDISNDDVMREGIMEGDFTNTWDRYYFDVWGDVANHITFKRPRDAYRELIDRISGKGTWQSNPWVYVYTFELIR